MKPHHYPSLELCKRLTEVGFPETEKFYCLYRHSQLSKDFNWEIRDTDGTGDYEYIKESYRCPSIAELLDEMPHEIFKKWFWKWCLTIQKTDISYAVAYLFEWVPRGEYFARTLLSDALAEMWLWLVENNYIPKK